MNLEDIGLSIALLTNKNNKKTKIVSVEDDEEKVKDYFEDYVCKKGETIQLIPIKQKERSVEFITGQSGSGKSTFAKKYFEQYHKMYKKREIYIFSYFSEDKSIDCNYIHRIKLDDKFCQTEFHLEEDFSNSLCLFDDIDCIRSKVLRNKLVHILHSLLELGRHHNCEVCYCSHLATKKDETRIILNECSSITIFPKVMNARSMKYLLENYFGMNKDQIKRIKQLKSRAVTICKTYPNIVIYEGGAYVLKTI